MIEHKAKNETRAAYGRALAPSQSPLRRPASILVLALVATLGCQSDKGVADGAAVDGADASERKEPASGDDAAAIPLPHLDPGDSDPRSVDRAVVVLEPTEGNQARGTIHFVQQADGVAVTAEIDGLPTGKHAYHVHVFGDCTKDDGSSAGTHLNFNGSSLHPDSDDSKSITGNLGDLVADADGRAVADQTITGASLAGQYSIIGRAVIIHELANDPAHPPMGATGKRLACGVIGIEGS